MPTPLQFSRLVRALLAACIVAAALLATPAPAAACPTCKDAIAENDPQRQQMVKGYFYSILFMMSTPFVVLGTFGSMAYLSVRRARRDAEIVEGPTNNTNQHQ